MNNTQMISPKEAAKHAHGALFLDVRTPAEYEDTHIDGSVLLPLGDLAPERVKELLEGKSGCVVVCRSGGRAKQACEKLVQSGLSNITILEGGVTAWEREGLPVIRGKKTISLERQVRIAAGSLVFIGAALGWLVNPAYIALSAFVGLGLVFSGITDTCGMAMVLGKMPWNTKGGGCCSGQSTESCCAPK